MWFYLRSETVSEEKTQDKNDFFGALRSATTAGRRKKQEEKFFDSRIVGPKAAERCFSSKLEVKTRRGERAQFFWGYIAYPGAQIRPMFAANSGEVPPRPFSFFVAKLIQKSQINSRNT